MNIRHEFIFSFETLLECEPQTRLAKIFNILDCNLVDHQLSQSFSRGPSVYNKASLLRALLAKYVYGILNTAKLVERLSSDKSSQKTGLLIGKGKVHGIRLSISQLEPRGILIFNCLYVYSINNIQI